jgi:hypothetical protein
MKAVAVDDEKESLLEQRCRQYALPAWPYQPAYDRIVVYMLPEDMALRETFASDGAILKPNQTRDYQKRTSPRAIIVAAGIQAMDHLRANMIDLGHRVWVARLSPWRHVVDRKIGGEVEFMFLRSSEIVGSEDTLQMMFDGKIDIVVGEDGQHHYRCDDQHIPRFDPPDFQDM